MSDLDQALRRLGTLPAPSGLATIDDAVLAGLAASRREAAAGSRLMGFAAALALVVGVAGGADEARRQQLDALLLATRQVLRNGLELIGVSTPARM